MRLLLRTANDLSGQAVLVDDDPALELHKDVYATPHEEEGRWGVFDRDDQSVSVTVERGLDPLAPLRQVPESPLHYDQVTERAPSGFDYVYGGRYVHHFGHFLIETLSRLWPWRERFPPRTRLVIHGDGSPELWFATGYARTALSALGLTPDDVLHVNRPLRFDRLLAPGQSFLPGARAHRVFGELTRRMGERMTAGLPRAVRGGPPSFMAKTRLIGGVSHLLNEHEIVERVRSRGVEIVHPQEMDLAQHVRFLESRHVISGWASSAHHPCLFTPEAGRFCMLAPERLNANFMLIDGLTRRPGDYWFAEGTRNTPLPHSTFIMDRVVADPVAVADALMEQF